MTKQKERIYKFKCGHVGAAHKDGYKKLLCKECGARVAMRQVICRDCGLEIFVNIRGGSVIRCPACQKKRTSEINCSSSRAFTKRRKAKRAKAKKAKAKKAKEKKAAVSRKSEQREFFRAKPLKSFRPHSSPSTHKTGCKFYEHCLGYDLKKDPGHCVRCQRFICLNIWGKAGYVKKSA